MKKKLLLFVLSLVIAFQALPVNAMCVLSESNISSLNVANILLNDITILDVSCYQVADYIDESEIVWDKYYYDATGTVYFDDGTTTDIQYGGFWIGDEYYPLEYTDSQSALTPWKVGNAYSVKTELFGIECSFNVTVAENPIAGIEIAPLTVIENTNMGTNYIWIDDQPIEYPVYYYYVSEFTVYYKDNTAETLTDTNAINIYGQEYYISTSDDQSNTNYWTVGQHTVHANLGGLAETDFEVEIIASPIQSISVDALEIKEGTNCWDNNAYDDYGNYLGTYLYYNITPENVKVTFTDGSTFSGSLWELNELYGLEYYFDSDQSFENPWLPGIHNAKLSVAGKEVIYQINIIASVIQNVIVPCKNIIEGTHCYKSNVYDEYGNLIGSFNRYNVAPEKITIECTDGKSYTGDIWELENELGVNIYYTDEQSYENQWGIGSHTATITVNGKSFAYDVVISESPIQYVSVDRITLTEGIDGYYIDDEFIYEIPRNYEFIATLQNGTIVSSQTDDYGVPSIQIGNESYTIEFSDFYNEDHSHWEVGNTYQISAKLCGKPCIVYVKIAANPYKSLSLEDSGDLYLVFTKNDGSQERQKVISFVSRAGDNGMAKGILTTDKSQFQHAVFYFDEEIYSPLQNTNTRLKIGNLTSNTLENSHWLAIYFSYYSIILRTKMYNWYAKQNGFSFNGFDGTVTTDNIDAVVTIAVNVCDYFGKGEIGGDGYPYGFFDSATVKKDVELLFGIKNIDLSDFSGYDASTGVVRVRELAGGNGPTVKDTLKYENGKWIIEYIEYSDEEMTSVCDYGKIIMNREAHIEKIDFNAVFGGVSSDNSKLSTIVELINENGCVIGQTSAANENVPFAFAGTPAGNYILQVSKEGCVTRRCSITIADGGASCNTELYKCGDMNGDGGITPDDYSAAVNIALCTETAVPNDTTAEIDYIKAIADADGDGFVDVLDCVLLERMLYA